MESGDEQLNRQRWMIAAAVAVTSFMLLFGLYPLWTIVTLLIDASADFGSSYGLGDVLLLLWQAAAQAFISTAATLAMGLPIAFLLSRFEFRGRRALQSLVMLPFVLPTMVTAMALRGLLEGRLSQGLLLVVVGHAFVNVAVVVRFVGTALENFDDRLLIQARTLGASAWGSWITVGLPLLRTAIVRSAVLVFGFCFSSLTLMLILGARSNRTFETEVLRQVSLLLDFRGAAINTVMQLICIALVLALSGRGRNNSIVWTTPARESLAKHRGWQLLMVCTFVCFVAPYFWLAQRSVSGVTGLSFDYWTGALFEPIENVPPLFSTTARSLIMALAAAIAAVMIAALSASLTTQRSDRTLQLVSRSALLPMMLTSATIGLGMLLSFSRPPFEWQRGGVVLVLAQSLLTIPIAYAYMVSKLDEVDDQQLVVAAALGATPAQAWRTVFLPTLSAAALSAAGVSTAISLGEFGAASFLSDIQNPNLSVAMMRLLSRPGEAAFAYATIFAMVLAALAIAAVAGFDAAARNARKVRV